MHCFFWLYVLCCEHAYDQNESCGVTPHDSFTTQIWRKGTDFTVTVLFMSSNNVLLPPCVTTLFKHRKNMRMKLACGEHSFLVSSERFFSQQQTQHNCYIKGKIKHLLTLQGLHNS